MDNKGPIFIHIPITGWMAERSKAPDSSVTTLPLLKEVEHSGLERGARSNRAPVNHYFCWLFYLLSLPDYMLQLTGHYFTCHAVYRSFVHLAYQNAIAKECKVAIQWSDGSMDNDC